jgi:hypothetical protein
MNNKMSLQQKIDRLTKQAAQWAQAHDIIPYYFWDQREINQLTYFPFPSIGDYCPDGYKLTRSLLCDHTGSGREDEPALTWKQLQHELQVNMAYAIIEDGPQQLMVGEFQIVPERD